MITPHPTVRSAFIAAALALFTGCITIEEHYTFNRKGGGTMTYVLDMSELGELMKSLGDGSSTAPPDMGALNMTAQTTAIQGIPGISKVKLDAKKDWVQRISFAFADVGALNEALNVLMPDSTGAKHAFFRWEGSTLVRTNNRHAFELGAGMAKGDGSDEDGDGEDDFDASAVLEAMKYKYSFKFARAIARTEAAEGVNRTQQGAKEVLLDTDFAVIGRDPHALDLRIALAP